jgi:hypothetical protein
LRRREAWTADWEERCISRQISRGQPAPDPGVYWGRTSGTRAVRRRGGDVISAANEDEIVYVPSAGRGQKSEVSDQRKHENGLRLTAHRWRLNASVSRVPVQGFPEAGAARPAHFRRAEDVVGT